MSFQVLIFVTGIGKAAESGETHCKYRVKGVSDKRSTAAKAGCSDWNDLQRYILLHITVY
jgi:hypothetical protein